MAFNAEGNLEGDGWLRGETTEPAVIGMFQSSSMALSQRGEDDFTALKRAALEKLKGKERQRAIVLPPGGAEGVQVVNAKSMSRAASRRVVKGLWREEEDTDVEQMLLRIRQRMEKVGIEHATIEVRYRNVCVETKAVIGDRRIPTLVRTVSSRVEAALGARNRTQYPIIEGVSGILRPGRLTLLLGPPGSGKSVLLRTLAGRMHKAPGVKVTGEITYNGKSFDQFVPERSAAYISQVDNHYGELTVRETLQISAQCQSSSYQRGLLESIVAREQQLGIEPDPQVEAYMRAAAFGGKNSVDVELTLRLLGLEACADTVVGNRMLRGCSGGERKRVTTGEMVVGPAKAIFADEISTGLDSNTTFSIMKSLRSFCHVSRSTFVIGLLQPAPETYDLFDDVILIATGKICYHGPLDQVLPLFEGMGFACPLRKGVADFLQEVTLPTDQQKYWAGAAPYSYVTVQTIEAAYHQSHMYKSMIAELEAPGPQDNSSPREGGASKGSPRGQGPAGQQQAQQGQHAERDVELGSSAGSAASGGAAEEPSYHALQYTKYGACYWQLFKVLFWRAYTLSKRTKLFVIVRTFQILLMSFVVATLFINTPKQSIEDGNLYLSVLFFSSIYMLMGGVAEMHLLTERLSVFYKQREMNFYPGWCFALPTFVFRIPYALLDASLWSLIIYWAVGFDNSVRYLMFWLLLVLVEVWSTSLFQAVASVCKEDTIASAVASMLLLILMNTGGFIINKRDIGAPWIAAYWSNPWSYFTIAMAANEFTADSWSQPVSDTNPTPMGIAVLQSRGFGTEYYWVWIGVGAACASIGLNLLIFILACTLLSGPSRSAILTEEVLAEVELNRGKSLRRNGTSCRAPSLRSRPSAASKGNGKDLELGKVQNGVIKTNGSAPSNDADGVAHVGLNGAATKGSSSAEGHTNGGIKSRAAGASIRGYQTALPFEPLAYTFKHISYSVPMPKGVDLQTSIVGEGPHAGQLRLLNDISGAFKPGVLCALMGASGAGKTTLMDVLAGRKTGGTISGEMRIKGFAKEHRTFARVAGYVEQDDSHLPQTTVREALLFSANLRLPTTVDAPTRARFVDEMMELVELDRLSGAYVGQLGANGLSLEQRKRLTIAVELVANPSIVFMDEPTTGLDARAATVVMTAVRNTVDTGRTVVCTIHQPSIDIFESFDELLLLKPGGECIYCGPLGKEGVSLITYFSRIPGVEPIKPRYNPANWMLEQTAPHHEEVLGIDFAEQYASSQLAADMRRQTEALHEPAPGAHTLTYGELNVTTSLYQFRVNLKRNFLMYWRFPEYNLIRLLVTLLVAFLFGTLFWDQGTERNTAAGVLNIAGVLYACTLFVGVTNCMTVQHVAAVQRAVSYRERAAGMYSPSPFSMAQLVVEVPYVVGQGIIFCCIAYWMIYFEPDAAKFFMFLLFFVLTLFYFTLFGIQNVMLTPSVALSNLLTSFAFSFWNLLSGFLMPQSRIPGWYIWVYWINPVSWTLYGLTTSQLGDLDSESIQNYNGQTETIPQFLEDMFGYKHSMLGACVGVLVAFCALFAICATVAFKRLNFQKR